MSTEVHKPVAVLALKESLVSSWQPMTYTEIISCIDGTHDCTSTSSFLKKICTGFEREDEEQTYASISGIRQPHTGFS